MAEKTAPARHHDAHDAHDEHGAGGDSRAELYRQAQEKDVPGRSKMNKEQLKAALKG